MLVLGRRPGEGIVIGDNIRVSVVKIDGEMKLTIDAPKEMKILRSEIYDKMQAEQAAADYMNS
ncbi:MAG: carbon storage regulator [Angelakisella sp.]